VEKEGACFRQHLSPTSTMDDDSIRIKTNTNSISEDINTGHIIRSSKWMGEIYGLGEICNFTLISTKMALGKPLSKRPFTMAIHELQTINNINHYFSNNRQW